MVAYLGGVDRHHINTGLGFVYSGNMVAIALFTLKLQDVSFFIRLFYLCAVDCHQVAMILGYTKNLFMEK